MGKTVITGATGLLGGNLAVELGAQGHEVRATRRAGSRAGHLDEVPIGWVEADLGDEAALARAFAGADVVFHCAAQVSIRRRPTAAMIAANVAGTGHVLAAVRRAAVPRLVHCSTVCAVGLSEDGRPCDEGARWNFPEHGMDDGYVTTKHESERLVHQAVAEGLDAVIVNPTYMFGPYDARPSSGRLIIDLLRGKVPGWTPGLNNFVDARDVARGMIGAWQRGRRGERYILGGENLSYRDVMGRIARVGGVRPPRLRVPLPLARVLGWAGDLQERLQPDSEPLINSVTVGWGFCTTFQFTSRKAERELGYTISPLDGALADAVAWFRLRGMLPPAP